jgi:hypothetical protein
LSQRFVLSALVLSFPLFSATASFKDVGGDDPTVLGGLYRAENCKATNPEENCPFIRIDSGSRGGGIYQAIAALFGGDIIEQYIVKSTPVASKKDFNYELLMSSQNS